MKSIKNRFWSSVLPELKESEERMAVVLKGKEVADAMTVQMRQDVAALYCGSASAPMTWLMNAELLSGRGLSI